MTKKLDTTPYKGVRDFYPEDMWLQKHTFDVIRKAVEKFGYVEYGASILEPADLYKAKSGEEIINEQTYTFTDRGGREVTLRPEMTPTVARMVAHRKRDLGFPLRWYSIPNLFRYENPQRGRLREHYQLNVDIFGVSDTSAEIEVLQIAHNIMGAFGATETDFSILINSRKLLNALFTSFDISPEQAHILSKTIDKKEKMAAVAFEAEIEKIVGQGTQEFIALLTSGDALIEKYGDENESVVLLSQIMESLRKLGITNVVFTPTLMRGFDYYTDIVFEVFDKHPDNRRSLFGGGRYDNLLELFGNETVPAVGFGMGDVTLEDFLRSHNLLPAYKAQTHAMLATVGSVDTSEINSIAEALRKSGLNIALNTMGKKPADVIKVSLKQSIPYIIFVGEDEIAKKQYTLKNLATEETVTLSLDEVVNKIKS